MEGRQKGKDREAEIERLKMEADMLRSQQEKKRNGVRLSRE